MTTPITIVDAFTDQPFGGNPAAVCVLGRAAPTPWMQQVAAEMNLSETAFVVPRPDGDHDLRWFTPTVEVDLCGHATLASAHVLGGPARFHTRSGLLSCEPADTDGAISMTLPAGRCTPADPAGWAPAFGLAPDRIRGAWASPAGWDLVECGDPGDVADAVMDRDAVIALGGHVILVADTSGSDDGPDSVCRVFVPRSGIDEDPVTGSAHTVIAPWLAARTGRTRFRGRQASARGGEVTMEVLGDRVVLTGRAVTVLTGTLATDPPSA